MPEVLQLGDTQVDASVLAALCLRYEIRELALFGSALSGEMRPQSDIDILVEFQPEASIGLVKFESLAQELESLLGRRIDLVTKHGLKPWIRPQVLKEARLIYAA